MRLKDPTLLRQQCFVGGEWIGVPATDVTDPATGAVIARVPYFGTAETKDAIAKAYAAFPGWAKLTGKARAAILRRWFELIIANRDDIGLIMTTEQGKPLAEAAGEVDYAASFVEFNGEEAKRIYGEVSLSHREDARIVVIKQPIGVVGAITPWNFPAAMITRKAAPALAAGCTMVVKPAEQTPLSALAIGKLAEEAGLPPGVLGIVTGNAEDAPVIGRVLTSSPIVRKLGFTGSTEIGKLLMAQCAGQVKKISLELGGNAPFIVFDDADLDEAVAGALLCKFRNSGQTCISANRILVQDGVFDEFVRRLTDEVARLPIGSGLEPETKVGPLIEQQAIDKVERHVADALERGGELLTGGEHLGGLFYRPTVITGVPSDAAMAREETFGPVAGIARFSSEADAIRQANDTPYGLSAYFYSRDIGRVWRVSEGLEYGIVGINVGAVSTEIAPFGGVKESGIGREGSKYGIDEWLEIKYLCMGGIEESL